MNIYEFLKANEVLIGKLVKNGIQDYYVIRNMEIYEAFQEMNKTDYKENCYLILAQQYELSKSRIEQICSFLSKRIK